MYSSLPSAVLSDTCASIIPSDPNDAAIAQARLDSLTKPLGSLGRLEEWAKKLFCIQRRAVICARPACVFTVAGDHGVVEEGVAAFPQDVTVQMVNNFINGGAAINALCATAGVDLKLVDAGVSHHRFPESPAMIDAKIANGTANFTKGPAMTREQCAKALETGIELARIAQEQGYMTVGLGEMGIGNTTPSSALLCAYLGFSPEEMTGAGAGAPPAGLSHKTEVIERALNLHAGLLDKNDPAAAFDILAALGGLEIAVLAGLIIGSASIRLAVMVDGFISTAAYAAACNIAPAVRDYCFFSHGSAESGHLRALEALGEKPLLELGMRVGEGTGAALGILMLEAAANTYNSMATFQSAGVDASEFSS